MEYSVEDSNIELRKATCSPVPDSFKKRYLLLPRACSPISVTFQVMTWFRRSLHPPYQSPASSIPGNDLRGDSSNLQDRWEILSGVCTLRDSRWAAVTFRALIRALIIILFVRSWGGDQKRVTLFVRDPGGPPTPASPVPGTPRPARPPQRRGRAGPPPSPPTPASPWGRLPGRPPPAGGARSPAGRWG